MDGNGYKNVVPVLQEASCCQEDTKDVLEFVYDGLKRDYSDYRLYYLLGKYLEHTNINQAFLCLENAQFFCPDLDRKEEIQKEKERLSGKKDCTVRPVAIVVLSYNLKQICIRCIDSIRRNNLLGTYEIIAVDNASSDGICEWLREQDDVRLISNRDNLGYPAGCNQAIKEAGDHDILILNNDIELQPNTVFSLRMGLYETKQVGATGCVTNYAGNGQAVYKNGFTVEAWRNYARAQNVPCENPYENKFYLGGLP